MIRSTRSRFDFIIPLLLWGMLWVLGGCAGKNRNSPASTPGENEAFAVAESDTSPLAREVQKEREQPVIPLTPELLKQLDPDQRFSLGLDRIARENFERLDHKRVMVATSRLALDSEGSHLLELLLSHRKPMVRKVVLFNDELPTSGRSTQIDRVLSRHPEVRAFERSPSALNITEPMMSEADVVLLDVPIRPGRFYGETAFIGAVLRAAAVQNVPVVLLDRPIAWQNFNLDGPVCDSSLLGSSSCYFPVVTLPSMTAGETAILFNTTFGLQAELDVVTLLDWDREDGYRPLVEALNRSEATAHEALSEWGEYVTENGDLAQWRLVAALSPPELSPSVMEAENSAYLELTLPPETPEGFRDLLDSFFTNEVQVEQKESSATLSAAKQITPATVAFYIWAAWTSGRPEALPKGAATGFANESIFDGLRQGQSPQDIIRRWTMQASRQDFVERRSEYLLYR